MLEPLLANRHCTVQRREDYVEGIIASSFGAAGQRCMAGSVLVTVGAAVLFAAVPFAVVPVFSMVFGRAAAWELLAPLSLVALGFFLNSTITVPYMLSLAAGQPDITVRLNLHALWVTLPATAGLVVRFGLLGGSIVDANALLRSYIWHCIGIPIVASVLMIVHFWRVRKDGGISGPAAVMLASEVKEPKK
jgi:quinol-cytochrome oxidoreductase complex cytochrome b subunit